MKHGQVAKRPAAQPSRLCFADEASIGNQPGAADPHADFDGQNRRHAGLRSRNLRRWSPERRRINLGQTPRLIDEQAPAIQRG